MDSEINLKDRYKEFKQFYLEAEECFKEKNYPVTISSLRSALERLSLIILCDVENSDEKVYKILEGELVYETDQSTIYDPADWELKRSTGALKTRPDGSYPNVAKIVITQITLQHCKYPNRKKIRTRGLIFSAQQGAISLLYKNQYNKGDSFEKKKEYYNLQQRVWNIFRELGDFYGDGNRRVHPGMLPIDEEVVAKRFLGEFEYLSEYLRAISVWSELSRTELGSFIKTDEEISTNSTDANEVIEANNEIERLKIATYNFSQEQRYILILPERISGLEPGCEDCQELLYAVIRCLNPVLVIDFNSNTDEGVFKNIPKFHDRIKLIGEDDYVASSEYINWLFAIGNNDDRSTLGQKWLPVYRSAILRITRKTCELVSPTNICVFSFVSDFRLLKKLGRFFDEVEDKQPDAEYYVFSNRMDIEEDCNDFHDNHEDITLQPFYLNFFELAHNIAATMRGYDVDSSKETGDCQLFFKGKSVVIPEAEVISYREAGIELVNDRQPQEENVKDDFYAGAEITWNDLDQHKDVDRDRWNDLLRKVEDIINKSNDTILSFSILHEPGAGATTLSRRLAYEIYRKNRRNELQRSCNVVVLFKNVRESDRTVNRLISLSQKIENNRLMVLYESCNISETEIDSLKRKLGSEGEKRKMLFVKVRPVQHADISKPRPNGFVLNDQLSPEEFNKFAHKYKSLNMSVENQKKMMTLSARNVIDFPLLLHEGEVSQNLQRYIDNQMDRLPEALQKTAALLSFAYYYSGQMSVNIQLFRSVFRDESHSLLGSYKLEERNVLDKLLIRGTTQPDINYCRPRYSKFAEFIMQNYFGRGSNSLSKWNQFPSRLRDAALLFIDSCGGYGDEGDDGDLFLSIFVQRRDDDYRAEDDKRFINKFSRLIQDINDPDRADEVLRHLCDTFPNNPYYNAHYGRFLFERAKDTGCEYTDELFKQAEKYVDIAIENNRENSDVYHIRGMFYSRLVGSLKNIKDGSQGSSTLLSLLESWTRSAEEAFGESEIRANDSAEYSYASEASLYKMAIELGKKIIGKEDYGFCEEEPWSEYVDRLRQSLSMLGDIVNNTESINQKAIDIYGKLLSYYSGIFGDVENREDAFYQKAFNGKLSRADKRKYGNLYYDVSVFGRMSRNRTDRRDVYRKLNESQYNRLEAVLVNNIELGDLESYDKLFELRLYGRGRKSVYTLGQAKDFVKRWHDELDGKNGQSLLTATFYLGVISAAQAIVSENKHKTSKVFEVEAKRFFQEASDIAKDLKKKTFVDYCAMGRLDDDFRCIVRTDSPGYDKSIISGVFTKIKGDRSGVVRLDCGLEATLRFDDRQIPDEMDVEKVRYKGTIMFRYEGLAMYGAEKVQQYA